MESHSLGSVEKPSYSKKSRRRQALSLRSNFVSLRRGQPCVAWKRRSYTIIRDMTFSTNPKQQVKWPLI